MRALPEIIQGGMGVAVSSFELARSVAQQGQPPVDEFHGRIVPLRVPGLFVDWKTDFIGTPCPRAGFAQHCEVSGR
jgi:hypothetical protein